MLERMRHARRHNQAFIQNLIQQQVVDIFNDAATRSLDGYDYEKSSIESLFPDYFEADKKLGAIDDERLMIIGSICLAYSTTDTVSPPLKAHALELGASSLQEAAFIQSIAEHNSIETVDERLNLIEAADKMLAFAMKVVPSNSEKYQRLALRRSFTPLHMDVVSGEVTRDTIDDLLVTLDQQTRASDKLSNRRVAHGLRGEIETLRHLWSLYKKKGDHIAIPSTVRGGSGLNNPAQTHDIDVIRQKRDGSWIVLPTIEVKRSVITDDIKQRYTESLLAQVGLNGTVTITGDHRKIVS